MPLRPSRILRKLRAGQTAHCIKLNLADPRVVEIAGLSGFDSVWLDMEHVPNNLQTIENQVRAAKATDTDTIVRVPRGSYSDLIYPLEMDAAGIMIPHVMSAKEAAHIAHQTKFHPVGRRALDGGNADGAFCTVPLSEYMHHANTERIVIAQIEDPEAMSELDAIAATPGIDMLLFGPGDFTQGLGEPGNFDHPELIKARQDVAKAANAHNKWAATTANLAMMPDLVGMGYHFLSLGADVVALHAYFSEITKAFGHDNSAKSESQYQK